MRLLSLDVLRAYAVLLVILAHTRAFVPWSPAMDRLAQAGSVGVDLFFVLSGFLVSGLLFMEQDKDGVNWQRFLIRRGFKLYPSLWCLVAVTVVVDGPSPAVMANACHELLFVQNYLPGLWGHTWSLAVEEHFYLLLPAVVILLPRQWIPIIAGAALLLCLELRCFAAVAACTAEGEHWREARALTHLRFDALLIGVWLRYVFGDTHVVDWCWKHAASLRAAGLALLAPALWCETFVNPYYLTLGLLASSIGAACLVASFVAGGVPDSRLNRALGCIGRHSYSIYLWHECSIFWFIRPLGISGPAAILIYAAASFITGTAMARLVELPALSLRDWLFRPRQQGRGEVKVGVFTAT